MKDSIKKLFQLVKNGKCIHSAIIIIENNKIDITQFKAYLHQENIHNLNPPFFKRVNDLSRKSNFELEMSEE